RFSLLIVYGKRHTTTRSKRGIRLLYGSLNVLRVVIATCDDNQFFQTPRDIEFAVYQCAQVARAKITSIIPLKMSTKHLCTRLRASIVTLPYALATEPNFSNLLGRADLTCRWIY